MPQNSQFNPPFRLLPQERLIFKTNPHWLLIVVPIIGIGILWLAYLLLLCPHLGEMNLDRLCYVFASCAFLWIALILYLDWRFNRLCLTNLRLVKERGIIGKSFMSIWLDRIEDISCSYGIWGRICGFGDLIIESAGTYGKMVFKGIPLPKQKKYLIEKEIKDLMKKAEIF